MIQRGTYKGDAMGITAEEKLFLACEAFARSRDEVGDERFPGVAEAFAADLPALIAAARESIRMRELDFELALRDTMLGDDA